MMTTGSLLAVVAVLAIAAAPNLYVFTAAWLLAGLAMAATFYQPAFAALTRWWGADRVRALTIVTLAGGLASTVFAPLTALLADHLSWRTTYLVLATSSPPSPSPPTPWPYAPPGLPHRRRNAPTARRSPAAALSCFSPPAFTCSGFAMYAVVFGMVALMTERGASPQRRPGHWDSAEPARPWVEPSTPPSAAHPRHYPHRHPVRGRRSHHGGTRPRTGPSRCHPARRTRRSRTRQPHPAPGHRRRRPLGHRRLRPPLGLLIAPATVRRPRAWAGPLWPDGWAATTACSSCSPSVLPCGHPRPECRASCSKLLKVHLGIGRLFGSSAARLRLSAGTIKDH